MENRGWSMSVGELRAAIDGIPDDYEVVLENAEVGDIDISSMHVARLMPPSLDAPGLLVLGGGQIISSEYYNGPRFDVWLEEGAGRWKNCALHNYEYGWTE